MVTAPDDLSGRFFTPLVLAKKIYIPAIVNRWKGFYLSTMKSLIYFCFLFPSLTTVAQPAPPQREDSLTYADLLKSVKEVELSDSLYINASTRLKNPLDTNTVKKWFAFILGSANNNRLKNRSYYLSGKITVNEHFDLLILLEKKKKDDSASVQVVYLITTKKDGAYIASIEAAVAGIRKKSNYNISSWLYKDNKIVIDSEFTVNETYYTDLTNYKINKGGRFILSPKYD